MVRNRAVTWDTVPRLLFVNLHAHCCSPELPEDILLASLTREVNTEIAPCNREVGVALNYSRSLLLMNVLYEPLKTVQIQCHCSACNCWAVRQDNHAPQECHIWKSVVTQLSPLPKLLSNLCRRFDEMLLQGN